MSSPPRSVVKLSSNFWSDRPKHFSDIFPDFSFHCIFIILPILSWIPPLLFYSFDNNGMNSLSNKHNSPRDKVNPLRWYLKFWWFLRSDVVWKELKEILQSWNTTSCACQLNTFTCVGPVSTHVSPIWNVDGSSSIKKVPLCLISPIFSMLWILWLYGIWQCGIWKESL